ncbi:MAG: right-handed parallel beta-helix repeat-containing protein [Bacteroides sp.]|jgi:poly(beta-D-mannuronate) lyase|nr:right-handed parallel beta-helix repeat-containing protein [Bacteroides sp.]MCI1681674.1 right-handed parallel beta-helix repeat-containing protein [Bacteroides sp.]
MRVQNIHRIFIASLFASLPLISSAKRYDVALSEVTSCLKAAQPGDQIYIKDGLYKNVQLKWTGTGTQKAPITIEALNPGKVKIEGSSTLRIAGEWLSISGLYFTDGYAPKGSVIEFRNEKELANHCRLTNCVIDGFNPSRRDQAYSYILLYGRYNRIDHCSLTGKLNLGVTLTVILNDERCLENHHQIDHNYFGEKPVYGSNGAETIRVGTSQQAYTSSNTVIENNLFERCSGEVEVISIKSCDNTVRDNVLLECEGVIALRHGRGNTVNNNLFIGHGIRNTGGIRVVDSGHQIHDNILVGLAGARFFSALGVMDAVPNSLPNRYCQVKDVKIYRNTFVDCTNIEFGTGKDMERTLIPQNVSFADNIIINKQSEQPYMAIDDVSGILFKDNKVQLAKDYSARGFSTEKVKIPDLPNDTAIRKNKGASWFDNKTIQPSIKVRKEYNVSPDANLTEVIHSAESGAIIILAKGTYAIQRSMFIDKTLTIRAADAIHKPLIRFKGDKPDNMVTIANGGQLVIENIIFDGTLESGKALAKAGISTALDMIQPYNLTVDGCTFQNFGESGFFAIKGTKATFAKNVTIKNCFFQDLSGDAINYAAEKDDIGRYNADDMLIENCSFYRLLGSAINIYRGGSDESTAGPYVTVQHCNFVDCCNKERGSVVRLIGTQVLAVENCNFDNSGRGGASIRLDEAVWEKIRIANCNLWNSGKIRANTSQAVKGKMYNIHPVYSDPEVHNYTPASGSKLQQLHVGLKK